jgi:hypothetical protein
MTLAEIFLLLLIVGWYGSRLESEGAAPLDPRPSSVIAEELKRAQEDLAKTRADLEAQSRDLGQLRRMLDWLAKTAGYPRSIGTLEDMEKAVDQIKRDAKRGRPACTADNVLVDVMADAGSTTVTLRQSLALASVVKYERGRTLRTQDEIDRFLADVGAFYRSLPNGVPANCVFDFRHSWRTDSDYRMTRERFEHYFYPAGSRQLQ